MSTELERKQMAISRFLAENHIEHYVWTWVGEVFTLADIVARVREETKEACAQLAYKMQSGEGRSEIGNEIRSLALPPAQEVKHG